jgi:hypothetical protein
MADRPGLPDVRCAACGKNFHPLDLGADGSCRECNPPPRPKPAAAAAPHAHAPARPRKPAAPAAAAAQS